MLAGKCENMLTGIGVVGAGKIYNQMWSIWIKWIKLYSSAPSFKQQHQDV